MNNSKYSNGDYQHAVGKMVQEDVRDCASQLVSRLYQVEMEHGGDYSKELQNVCIQYTDNSEEIEECEEKIEELETMRDDMIEELEELEHEIIDRDECDLRPSSTSWDGVLFQWVQYQINHTEKVFTDLIDRAESEKDNLESEQEEPVEAYEHWIVSDWLGRHLKERGEMVEDVYCLTIWGRCTTGQSILLDRVICDIYDDIYGDQWKEA